MNRELRIALALASVASSALAQGEAKFEKFQFELEGGWSQFKADTSPEFESTDLAVVGTYHLKPVALASNPWNEAAFLERSTFFQAGLDFAEVEQAGFSSDGVVYGLGGRYADKESPLAAEVTFLTGSLTGDADIDLSDLSGRVGYWCMSNAILGLSLGRATTEIETLPDVEVVSFGAFGKIVHDLGEGRAVNFAAELDFVSVDDTTSTEDNVEFGLLADYYFTQKVSLGAQAKISSGDNGASEGTTLGVRGSMWFTPQLSANASYSHFAVDDDALGSDDDTISLFFLARF